MNAVLNFSGARKTPLILQTEAAECGLACLAMVAGYHGYRTDLATLRGKYSISLKGTTLTNLIKIAAQLNLSSRPLRLELSAVPKLRLPAVLHWDLNHFVVLTEIGRHKAVVFDPNVGRRTLSSSEFSKHFTGIALELTPNEQFERKTERSRLTLRQLVGRMPGLGATLGQLLLLALIVEVFAIASPWFMQLVLDHAVVAGDRSLLTVLGLGFLLLTLIKVGVTALRSWVALYLNTILNLQMLARLFTHLLQLPMAYFGRRHLGDIVSRFESLSTIRRTVTTNFLEGLLDGVMGAVTALMMFIYSWKLSLIVCAATVLYGVLRVLRYGPLREATEDQLVCAARQETNFLEAVRGIQCVKLFNRQEQRAVAYQNLAVDTFNANIRLQKLRLIFTALNGVLFGVENITVIWMGAALLLDGGFSVGMFFAFISYKSQFTSRMSSLIDNVIEFKMLDVHRGRVADIALTEPEPELRGVGLAPAKIRADIEVRNLSVRYADSEPFILQGLNLRIEEGQSVAIVGPSGCGKTTLLKAMMGLLVPTEGEILIGGISLSRLGTAQYRDLIGSVMQDDQLFSGSLADNIAFFDPQPEQERIEACARLAAIHDDILAMPMGYQTLVGDMGTTLSGGQKQRVLLARALYKQPKILLLDEATSHLDGAREQQVSEAVRHLKLTRVIVAHRRETIATADCVFHLGDETQIVESLPLAEKQSPAKLPAAAPLRFPQPADKHLGKSNPALSSVGADLRVCPGDDVPAEAGADTQVCPYDLHHKIPASLPRQEKKLISGADEFRNAPKVAAARNNSSQPVAARLRSFSAELGSGIRLEMHAIPGGEFLMGSPPGSGAADEQPQHRVTLSAFFISKYPITQEQWRALMQNNPSHFQGAQLPAHSVTWDETVEFCRRLSQATGRRYRLPSEAEWEYASRAGAQTRFNFKDDEERLAQAAWFLNNAGNQPHPVGLKRPNGWGLYDMFGNVWEWCGDWYDASHYHSSMSLNPTGPDSGTLRVLRGGSWFNAANACRAARRGKQQADLRDYTVGFRVVCETNLE